MNPFTIDADGWLHGVLRVDSPNCDDRPTETTIDLLIVHNISLPPGQFGGPWIDALFTNRLPSQAHPYFASLEGMRVSAHALIRREGTLVQYVPFLKRAWHAGVSTWQGRVRCNDFSVGIELEGSDATPFTEEQYRVLVEVTRCLMAAYPGITPDRIVGHSDVAPVRKTDPGPAFDWARLHQSLSGDDSQSAQLAHHKNTPQA